METKANKIAPQVSKKKCSLFLIHGENEVEINKEKNAIIDSILSPEEKSSNLVNYEPPQGRLLTLSSIMSELMAEMTTLSLLPDSKRMAVITDLENLFASKKTNEDLEKFFLGFLEKELPGTENAILFINIENFEKNRSIGKSTALYKLIAEKGAIKEFKETPIAWQIEPLILQRNIPGTIALYREWIKKDTAAPRKLFSLLVKALNLLIQIKIYQNNLDEIKKATDLERALFPSKMSQNIKKINPYVLRRYENAAELFSLARLKSANKKLLDLNKVVFPQTSDLYVPDINTAMETYLLKFLSTEEGEF